MTMTMAALLVAGGTVAGSLVTWAILRRPPQRVVPLSSSSSSTHGNKRNPRAPPSVGATATAAYERLVGHTPMIHLALLSQIVQRDIFVKMESLNPSGTGKDRAALGMVQEAERLGLLPSVVEWSATATATTTHTTVPEKSPRLSTTTTTCDSRPPPQAQAQTEQQQQQQKHKQPIQPRILDDNAATLDGYILDAMRHSTSGGLLVEGTSGSTGIALATVGRARGHACLVTLPDDQAMEKQHILRALGAVVVVVPPAAIAHPNHYVNLARRLAHRARTVHGLAAVFVNQFENLANVATHYQRTGPEIWHDCQGCIDAFCMAAGTGGTLAGVGRYLKEQAGTQVCRVILVDPPGSVLYHKIRHGVAYAPQQAERSLRRHRYDTLAEGIGLDRLTDNFTAGLPFVDDAIRVSDQEAVDMAHYLLRTEGLWVGSSSAMNVVGAIRTALGLPQGSRVVTVLCDAGSRHVTRFWNREFIESWGLIWPQPEEHRLPECLQPVYASCNGIPN